MAGNYRPPGCTVGGRYFIPRACLSQLGKDRDMRSSAVVAWAFSVIVANTAPLRRSPHPALADE